MMYQIEVYWDQFKNYPRLFSKTDIEAENKDIAVQKLMKITSYWNIKNEEGTTIFNLAKMPIPSGIYSITGVNYDN